MSTSMTDRIRTVIWDIGAHVSFNGNIYDSIKESVDNGMYATQFFLGSPQSLTRHTVKFDDFLKTNDLLHRFPTHVFSHFPYICNLAGSVKSLAWNGDAEQDEQTLFVLKKIEYELSVLRNLKMKHTQSGVVIHPGSFPDRKKGLEAIIKSINKINFPENSKLILENCAGEGNKIPRDFYELKSIIDGVDEKKQDYIGVCIDTAHIWGMGIYNLTEYSEVDRMFKEFDEIIGIEKLSLVHLNDSGVPLGSKKDLHANLGMGHIWSKNCGSLLYLLDSCFQRNIPIILETCIEDMVTIATLGHKFEKTLIDLFSKKDPLVAGVELGVELGTELGVELGTELGVELGTELGTEFVSPQEILGNSKKQKAIYAYLNSRPNRTGSLQDILDNVRESLTCNNSKGYLSETLSRMIKKNIINRVGRGLYQAV